MFSLDCLPLLAYQDGKVTVVRCKKCNVDLHRLESEEQWDYFVGNHVISIEAQISKGKCHICGDVWEQEDAKCCRDEAFLTAIDNFWKTQLDAVGVTNEEMASVMFVVTRIMMRLGNDKKRQVAAELGRWLAGVHFMY